MPYPFKQMSWNNKKIVIFLQVLFSIMPFTMKVSFFFLNDWEVHNSF